MTKRKLTRILQKWLQENEGWHSKAHLTDLKWHYDGDFRVYSADTVCRKLREATEEGLIHSRLNERGQTEYSASQVSMPKYIYDPYKNVMKII